MSKGLLNKLNSHLKTFGFFHSCRKIFFTSILKRIIDNVVSDHLYSRSSFHYLDKFYMKFRADLSVNVPSNDVKENEFIYWTCWFNGLESAPPLVKSCINSATNFSDGYRLIIINKNNINTYTSLPYYIIEKHNKGIIQTTHLADILRLYLLYVYGGVWFDSTVLFTQKIPDNLIKQPLFFLRSPLENLFSPVSSWFIIAKRKNLILFKLLCIYLKYWQINNKYIDYFMFHYFLQSILNNENECSAMFNKMPYQNNQNAHYMQKKLLFNKYDPDIWETVKNISFCHKITYKFPETFNENDNYSFYSYICDLIK